MKKGKNDILYASLEYMCEIHNKRFILMVDNDDKDSSKICFCKLCISSKITQNTSKKPISEVTTKLGRVYMDLRESFPNIFLEWNCYI